MLIFGVATAIIVGLSVWCLARVHREYRRKQTLSTLSVTGVWVLYLVHLGTTIAASALSVWCIPLVPTVSWGAGILLIGIGAIVCGIGTWSFHSFKRMSGQETTKLVTTGIYRWSRNPQNVGWVLLLLGVALLGRSGLAVLLTVLFWGLFVGYTRLEEQYLGDVFGEEYREYKGWSHRYFGPPRKPSQG